MSEDYIRKLVEDGVISEDQLAEAEGMASSLGISTADALVRLGYVSSMDTNSLILMQWKSLRVSSH